MLTMNQDISTDYCSPDHPKEAHPQKQIDKIANYAQAPDGVQAQQATVNFAQQELDPNFQSAILLKPHVPPHAYNGKTRPLLPIPVDRSFAQIAIGGLDLRLAPTPPVPSGFSLTDPLLAGGLNLAPNANQLKPRTFQFEAGQVRKHTGIKLPVPATYNDPLFNLTGGNRATLRKSDKIVLKTFLAGNFYAKAATPEPCDMGTWLQHQMPPKQDPSPYLFGGLAGQDQLQAGNQFHGGYTPFSGDEESVDSQGHDLGYVKRLLPNNKTRRPNQLLICKYCGKSYTKLYNIIDHVHMHRGLTPYKCHYCDKRFSQMANRNRHEKKVCQKRFELANKKKDSQGSSEVALKWPTQA